MTAGLHCTGPPHNGHLEVVKALLAAQADVNKANNTVRLHCTGPPNGHLEVVKALLAAQADVNKADNDGRTPLYWASREWALGGGQGPACSPGRREQGQ